MARYLALRTLEQIEKGVANDQGNTYRGFLKQVMPTMSDAYRTDETGNRSHLGASLIGRDCGRSLWYSFRWAVTPRFSGQLLRLFNRGHLEEARFIAMLLAAGMKVYQQDENGNQFRCNASAGHFGGSCDGVVMNCLDVPKDTPALVEFKTHNDSSFSNLENKGVKISKFEHYVQMQIYMRKMALPVTLYLAVNKDNDALYGEIVLLDIETADQFLDRADKIIWMNQPPAKLNESPGFWKCRFCDHKSVCHLDAKPEQNCRTCAYGNPDKNSSNWLCDKTGEIRGKIEQRTICDSYKRGF